MTAQPLEITIPPEALEAGANVLCNAPTLVTMAEARNTSRAAFLAMLNAWPGMNVKDFSSGLPKPFIILPLTQQEGDA